MLNIRSKCYRILPDCIAKLKEVGIFHFRGKRAGRRTKPKYGIGCSEPVAACTPRMGPMAPDNGRTNTNWPRRSCNFNCSVINARSIVNKALELEALFSCEKLSIIAVAESWLHTGIPDTAVCPSGTTMLRHDRKERKGGGVCLLIDSSWSTTPIDNLTPAPEFVETVWALTRPHWLPRNITGFLVCAIYIPPGINPSQATSATAFFNLELDRLRHKYPFAQVILMGDFNNYDTKNVEVSNKLKQIVNAPTRGTNILDLIITSVEHPKVRILPPLGLSDHNVVVASFKCNGTSTPKPKTLLVKTRPKPLSAITECGKILSSTDWSSMLEERSIDESYLVLKEFLIRTADSFFPTKLVKTFPRSKPWISQELISLIKKRNEAFKSGNRDIYAQLRSQTTDLISSAKSTFYARRVACLRTKNPRMWHRRIRELGGAAPRPSQIDDQMNLDDLNDYFVSLGGDPPRANFESFRVNLNGNHDDLVPLSFLEFQVATLLRNVNIFKSQPQGDIPNFLLKQFWVELAKPFMILFNRCLQTGRIPAAWKVAEVIPLPKCQRPSEPCDFRPIALLPTACRVFEKEVAKLITRAFSKKVDGKQFGAIKGRSTTHYLTTMLHSIHLLADANRQSTLVAYDFLKAFNSVNHDVLLPKLSEIDAPPETLLCAADLLDGLSQYIYVKNRPHSATRLLHAGIPQGSSLGPVLFAIVINDCPSDPDCDHWKFYDDVSLLNDCSSFGNGVFPPQKSLASMETWCQQNVMSLNPDKCKAVIFDFRKAANAHDKFPNLITGTSTIEFVNSVKVLGITIQNDLKWDILVHSMISKANSKLFFLRCLFKAGLNSEVLRSAYLTHVRPTLEYCSPLWNESITKKQTADLESIQKRAVKLILGDWKMPYEKALCSLDLDDLSTRRQKASLKFAWSIFRSDLYRGLFPPVQGQISGRNGRHADKLAHTYHRTERMRNSSFPAFTRLLNASDLPLQS